MPKAFTLEDLIYPLLGKYMAAPQWMKSLAGHAYSRLPARLRHGTAYARYASLLRAADPAAVRAHADAGLAQTLSWAVRTVPAYRDYGSILSDLDRPGEALLRLPLVSKDDIKGDLGRYLSAGCPVRLRLRAFTGGSTAAPMEFYLHKGVTRAKEFAFFDRYHGLYGKTRRAVTLALRGRTVTTAARGGRLWMFEPVKRHLIFSSDHLEARFMPHYIDGLVRWRPTFIEAFPSALYPLARWLRDHPRPDVTGRIQAIFLTSENVYDYQYTLFKEVFGCPVLKHYGHSERVLFASNTASDESRYYFWPQYGHMELVDPQGRPITQPGVIGELVGTSFDNAVQPFVRYRTGDFAVLSEHTDPALPGYPCCASVEGRLQEFVVCEDRRLVSITTLGAAHFEQLAKVKQIQYEQHVPGRLVLHVVASEDLSDADQAAIGAAVKNKTQGGCEVRVDRVERIERTPRGKHRMLIQHLDISGFLGAASLD